MDTLGLAPFTGPGGQARTLKALSLQYLSAVIQTDRHSAT